MARIFRLNESLDYGLMGFNTGLITTVEAPFGGFVNTPIFLQRINRKLAEPSLL